MREDAEKLMDGVILRLKSSIAGWHSRNPYREKAEGLLKALEKERVLEGGLLAHINTMRGDAWEEGYKAAYDFMLEDRE